MILRRCERWLTHVIEKEGHLFLKALLHGVSLCFQGIILVRHYLYDKGWKSKSAMPLPVVCIGNITAGGNGKTPLVAAIAQDLKKRVKLAIIATGYRSLGVKEHAVISTKDRRGRSVAASYCGDEPCLLDRHLVDVPIFVSKQRKRAITIAYQRGAEIALLDDGFQSRSLVKDLSVLVFSARDLWGKGYYLPRGLLRDSPHRLKEADFLCVTAPTMTEKEFFVLCGELKNYSQGKIFGARLKAESIRGEREYALEEMRGKKVGVFCGIGKPQNFLETLQTLGAECVATLFLADHSLPSAAQWQHFLQEAEKKEAEILLCTEKDFVKIPEHQYDRLPISYVDIALEVVYGKEHYETLKNKIVDLATKGS